MEVIKENVEIKVFSGRKVKMSLFRCPVCKKTVERRTAHGKMARACSRECGGVLGRRTYVNNPCPDCAVDNCEWLLKGKRVKGWKAVKIFYPGKGKFSHTYKIAYCPNFKEA